MALRFAARPTFVAALQGGIVAAVANYAVFVIARIAGVPFLARFDGADAPIGPLPLPAIAISSIVPAFVGAALLLALDRFTRRGPTIFVGVAAIATLLSLAGPHALVGASIGTRLALDAMHFVAAGAIVYALSTRGREL